MFTRDVNDMVANMKTHVFTIEEMKEAICEIAQRYGVERVTLFGSYARGEARLDSDIDLLISKGRIRGLFELSGFHLDLEERLNTHIDILTADCLDEKFLRRINREEIVLYEQQ